MTFTTIITNIPGYRGIYLDLSLSVSGDYSTQSQGRAVPLVEDFKNAAKVRDTI